MCILNVGLLSLFHQLGSIFSPRFNIWYFLKYLVSAMPIRSPKGDLGPLGDFSVKIGPLLVPFFTKSPLSSRLNSIIWLN